MSEFDIFRMMIWFILGWILRGEFEAWGKKP